MHFFFYVNENITAFEEIRKNRKTESANERKRKAEIKA